MEKKARKEHSEDAAQTLTGKICPEQHLSRLWQGTSIKAFHRNQKTGNASEPTYHTASHRTEFSKLFKMIKSNLCLSLILFKITAKHIGTEKQEIS